MAVTFETDIKDIHERPYVEQLPLDAMFRGMGYKQSQYDQDYQQLQGAVNSIDNIQAVPGSADESELQTLKDKFRQDVGQLSKVDLSTRDGNDRVNQLIGSYTSALTKSGIPQRNAAWGQMTQAQKEAELKGKPYMDTGMGQAQNYIRSGKFNPDMRFNSNPIPYVDIDKELSDKANTLKLETDPLTGMQHYEKGALSGVFNELLETNPYAKAQLDWTFDQAHPEISSDWNSAADKYLGGFAQQYYNEYLDAKAKGDNKIASVALKWHSTINDAIGHPGKGEMLKQLLHNENYSQRGNAYESTHQIMSAPTGGLSEIDKLKFQRETEMEKAKVENQYKIEQIRAKNLASGYGDPQPVLQEFHDIVTGNNVDPTMVVSDDSGAPKKFSLKEIGDNAGINVSHLIGSDDIKIKGNDKDWFQYTGDVDAINEAAGQRQVITDDDGNMKTVFKKPDLQTDNSGNQLVFVNQKTHQIGYIDAANGDWHTLDYSHLVNHIKANAKGYQLKDFKFPATLEEFGKPSTTHDENKSYTYNGETYTYKDLVQKYGTAAAADSAITRFGFKQK